ncbi:MAG: xanthine dehydrogenase family protein subunit M [Zestosphaera sp.]
MSVKKSIHDVEVVKVHSLQEALEALSRYGGKASVLAGGSDVIVLLRRGRLSVDYLIDVSGVTELRYIDVGEDNSVRIGALTTLSELAESEVLRAGAPLIVEAARRMATWQIRNIATAGGNIGRASPAGDLLLTLYVLEGEVTLRSINGSRTLRIDELVVGPGKLNKRSEELITEVRVKALDSGYVHFYRKAGSRRENIVATVNIAGVLRFEGKDGEVSDARIAVGAVAPTPLRLCKLEEALVGTRLDPPAIERLTSLAIDEISPITDIRGSAEYRRALTKALLYEALLEICRRKNC